MTRDEARLILGVYRCGKDDAADPFFVAALQLASEDVELAKWFAAEQAFDAQVTAGLAQDASPVALKAALLATNALPARPPWSLPHTIAFPRALALAAAFAVAAALLTLAFLQPRRSPTNELADFRAEMVGFLLPPPSLMLETKDLAQARAWLAQNVSAMPVPIPAKAQVLPPVGCRALVFRGHKVGLLCFERSKGKLVHLLVVDRAAFDESSLPSERAFSQEGEWMTAAWTEGGQLYLLAAQGNRADVKAFF